MVEFSYKPEGNVLKRYLKSNAFVRGIRGPVGSGKSAGNCVEIFRRACEQEPGNSGIRQSKWAVIRNTNPELRTTTIATWLQWFPEDQWGNFRWSPPYTHHIRKGDVDLEVLFLPLDTPEDVKKLLSLELTGCFINEAREVPKAIIDGATSRVGRFPSMKDGIGPTWHGLIMDTNAPETDHWWPVMSGETPIPEHISEEQALMLVKPDNWEFYTQPPGMIEQRNELNELQGYETNPLAENLSNLPPLYYENMIRGKMKQWIDVYVMNRLGSTEEGKPVYQGFAEKTHISMERIEPADLPIFVGIDFGLTPAAAFLQNVRGRWLCLAELVAVDMGAKRFAEVMKRFMGENFPEHRFNFYGDPTGDYRVGTDETTPFQIMRAAGIRVLPAPSNDPVIRVEAVNQILARMVDGEPGFLIDKEGCPTLVTGFLGGYHYRRLQVSGDRYDDKPNKNKFSHIHDGLQYAILGGGEGRELLRGAQPLQPFVAKGPTSGSFFKRRKAAKREAPTQFR